MRSAERKTSSKTWGHRIFIPLPPDPIQPAAITSPERPGTDTHSRDTNRRRIRKVQSQSMARVRRNAGRTPGTPAPTPMRFWFFPSFKTRALYPPAHCQCHCAPVAPLPHTHTHTSQQPHKNSRRSPRRRHPRPRPTLTPLLPFARIHIAPQATGDRLASVAPRRLR